MGLSDILGLLGGLGLFIFGMKLLSDGLEMVAGSRLEKLLKILTTNRFMAVVVGFLITAIIQSSSATTVMVVGFVNAGLMSLTQSVGIIMGANIGTTITSVIVALNPKSIAPAAIFIGVAMIMTFRRKTIKDIGQILAGLGILFTGLNTMSTSMEPLRNYQPFIDAMTGLAQTPLLGVLAGIILTAVLQSSSASVGILQALAMENLIGIHAAVFVLFGQNIGTCATALLSSIGTSKTAKRAAVIHLLFNVFGTIVFIGLYIIGEVTALPTFIEIIQRVSDNPVVQISAAHIIFNVVSSLILFPLAPILVSLSQKIVRGEDKVADEIKLKYIDDRILTTPSIAVGQVVEETKRMAGLAKENLLNCQSLLHDYNPNHFKTVQQKEKVINFLNHSITDYLVKLSGMEILERDSKIIGALFHIINDLERIGDHADNIAEGAKKAKESKQILSASALQEIDQLFELCISVYDRAITVMDDPKVDLATVDYVIKTEEKVDALSDQLEINHIRRLTNKHCTPETGMLFMNLVNNLERVSDHSTNILYSIVGDPARLQDHKG